MARSHSLKQGLFAPDASASVTDGSAVSANFRRAVGVERLAPQWVSAAGSGGLHFPARSDRHQHGLQESRHQASEDTKWRNRQQLRAHQAGINILHHDPTFGHLTKCEAALGAYDVNGKVFYPGKAPKPLPPQASGGHWLCQVNGLTSDYNVINNLPSHPHLSKCRKEDLEKHYTGRTGVASGDVAPQRPVACYEIIGYPPVHKRNLLGVSERHHLLFS